DWSSAVCSSDLLGEGLGEVGLPAPGGADEEHVRFREFHLVLGGEFPAGTHTLVVVVDRDGEGLFRALLTNHVFLEMFVDLPRLGEFDDLGFGVFGEFLGDDFVAELDAFHTDIDAAPGDQPLRLLLGLATEGAREQVSTFSNTTHQFLRPLAWATHPLHTTDAGSASA